MRVNYIFNEKNTPAMKNVILFLILSCSTFHSLSAQNIVFPDGNFKQALLDVGVDTGNDGEISQAEALAITSLDVSGRGITDLTGIENFTNLQTLHCEYNSLTSLDVSGLTSLESLYCHNNSLTSLDVSGLANLGYLFCDNNSLTSLDVSGLTSLRLLHCYNNPLTTIDIRSTPELEYFHAQGNPDLECIVVDDVNDLPDNRSVDQGDGIFTTEPCVVSFEGFEGLCALVQSSGLPSIKEAALLATLKVAEASCTAGKKWMAVTSLITFDAMVARLQQLGRLSANEADQILEASGLLQDDILSGEVDCSSGTPTNILDWITSWYSLDAAGPGTSDDPTIVHPDSLEIAVNSAPRIYPNPTVGRVTFSHIVNQVEVYNMMGQLMMKAEHTDHLDLYSYQAGVYVIRTIDEDGEGSVKRVVKR